MFQDAIIFIPTINNFDWTATQQASTVSHRGLAVVRYGDT